MTQLQNLINTEQLIKTAIQNSISSLGILIFAIIIKLLLHRLVRLAIKRLEDDDPDTTTALEARAYTLGSLGNNIINLGFIATTSLMILSSWRINIGPILAGAGILGLAVGFGTQTLVKDIVTGFFILLENQFNVGDRIKIAGLEGKVAQINLRTTILKGKDKQTHIIPNSRISDITKYSK